MKIGIANDSIMATEVLRRIITSSQSHEVLWIAANGAEAIMHCHRTKPDLILMDLMMPVMDGIEATRRIMKSIPCAILVVTATVAGRSSEVFEAMGVGALDVVATPVFGTEDKGDGGKELLRKIDLIGKLLGFSPVRKDGKGKEPPRVLVKRKQQKWLVAIGSSTGGPQALCEVLSSFSPDINASIVVVQHLDKKFTTGLVSWLNKQLAIPVRIIEQGNRMQKGVVLVPNTNNHLISTAIGTLCYTEDPIGNVYHPSVDVFFNSIARHWPGKIIGALLTGMGRDGAQGMLNLKKQGHHTIAQDEGSSVVYGMPKAAIELNGASEVLPLHLIGARIVSLLQTRQ